MNYEQSHRKLISGQSRGLGALLLRALLRIASFGYSAVVRLRNFLYSKGLLTAHRVNAPIICVGNITVGGTGKTPIVTWLCRQIAPNFRCAILTRGYKSTQESNNYADEPAMLAENCPGVKVIVNPDRVSGAAEAIDRFGAEVLIMDDGFQHRRLARNLDIIAIDATQPFGYGKMLPAGLLREPATSLKRAGAVVITRCDQIDDAALSDLEAKLRTINPDMIVAKSTHSATSIEYPDSSVSAEQLKGKKVFAFCGIGNPDAFLNTIRALGAELLGSRIYGDHHQYTESCLVEICEQAHDLSADLVLTTQKDWTKIISDFKSQISNFRSQNSDGGSSIPFACLNVEIQFLTGGDELKSLIESKIAGRIPGT